MNFETDDHLCEAVWHQIYYYNHKWIHITLAMFPT